MVKPTTTIGTCCYIRCNNSFLTDKEITFFKFPDNLERRKKWITNCGNPELGSLAERQLRGKRICIDHFPASSLSDKSSLKDSAVPLPFDKPNTQDQQIPSASNQGKNSPAVTPTSSTERTQSTPSSTVKRGRGRPPKIKVEPEELDETLEKKKSLNASTNPTEKNKDAVATSTDKKEATPEKKKTAVLPPSERKKDSVPTPVDKSPFPASSLSDKNSKDNAIPLPIDKANTQAQQIPATSNQSKNSQVITPTVSLEKMQVTVIATAKRGRGRPLKIKQEVQSDSEEGDETVEKKKSPSASVIPTKKGKDAVAISTDKKESQEKKKTPAVTPSEKKKDSVPIPVEKKKEAFTEKRILSASASSVAKKLKTDAINISKDPKPLVGSNSNTAKRPPETTTISKVPKILARTPAATKSVLPGVKTEKSDSSVKKTASCIVTATVYTKPSTETKDKDDSGIIFTSEEYNIADVAPTEKCKDGAAISTDKKEAAEKKKTAVLPQSERKKDSVPIPVEKKKEESTKKRISSAMPASVAKKLKTDAVNISKDPKLLVGSNSNATKKPSETTTVSKVPKIIARTLAASKLVLAGVVKTEKSDSNAKKTTPSVVTTTVYTKPSTETKDKDESGIIFTSEEYNLVVEKKQKRKKPRSTEKDLKSKLRRIAVDIIQPNTDVVEVESSSASSCDEGEKGYEVIGTSDEDEDKAPVLDNREFERFHKSLKSNCVLPESWNLGAVLWDPSKKMKVIHASEVDISSSGGLRLKRSVQIFETMQTKVTIDGFDLTNRYDVKSVVGHQDVTRLILRVARSKICSGMKNITSDDAMYFPEAIARGTLYYSETCPVIISKQSTGPLCNSCHKLKTTINRRKAEQKRSLDIRRAKRSSQHSVNSPFGKALYTLLADLLADANDPKSKKKKRLSTLYTHGHNICLKEKYSDAQKVERSTNSASISYIMQDIVSKMSLGKMAEEQTEHTQYFKTEDDGMGMQLLNGSLDSNSGVVVQNGGDFTLAEGQEYELIGEVDPNDCQVVEMIKERPETPQQIQIIQLNEDELGHLQVQNVDMFLQDSGQLVSMADVDPNNQEMFLKVLSRQGHGFQ